MQCPRCGNEQQNGNFCDRCGQPLSVSGGSNKVKGSKAPVILTLAALCGILFGVGLFFMFFSEKDKIQTQSEPDSSAHGGFVSESSSSESSTQTTSETTAATTTTASETTEETTKETTSETTKKATEKPSETTTTEAKTETEKQTETTPETTTTKETTTTTTKAAATTTSKPANISVIAASKLATMTTNQVKAIIGNNYKATTHSNVPNGMSGLGITSDYFPNVLLCYNGINNASGVKGAFDAGENFVSVCVFQGGYLGENARVGETFSDLIIKIQCLGAGEVYDMSGSYIASEVLLDGCSGYIYFDHASEFRSLYSRYGSNLVDGCQTNAKSVAAVINRQSPNKAGSGKTAVVTTSRAPLMIAPYDDASHMWAMPSGTTILTNGTVTVKGVKWYYVTDFRTSKGTRKFGFVKASDIRI